PPRPTLFPYTTLFRSVPAPAATARGRDRPAAAPRPAAPGAAPRPPRARARVSGCAAAPARGGWRGTGRPLRPLRRAPGRPPPGRSEEHTSELQSRENL